MKISIVIAILNSHYIVKLQIRHFRSMNLPNNVEFIFVDDGSNPPLNFNMGLRNLHWYYTNDKRPWTQGLARNLGASKANGEYLFFTDIDHIISKEAIDAVLNFDGDKMVFPRFIGILDRHGNVIQDLKTLFDWGYSKSYYRGRRGLFAGYHGNTYAIKREIFNAIGGYEQGLCENMFHVGGRWMSEERKFNIKWQHKVNRNIYKPEVTGPKIFVYPVSKFHQTGDNNPHGLFHKLSLKQGTPLPMLD